MAAKARTERRACLPATNIQSSPSRAGPRVPAGARSAANCHCVCQALLFRIVKERLGLAGHRPQDSVVTTATPKLVKTVHDLIVRAEVMQTREVRNVESCSIKSKGLRSHPNILYTRLCRFLTEVDDGSREIGATQEDTAGEGLTSRTLYTGSIPRPVT